MILGRPIVCAPYMLAERLGECLLDGALRRLVIQNERQALGEDAVKYSLLTPH